MPTHIREAISQKLEMISFSVIYHWKAYDINFKVGFFLGVPFSLACTQMLSKNMHSNKQHPGYMDRDLKQNAYIWGCGMNYILF